MEKYTVRIKQKGFTLIEIIVVITILGILMAILIPSLLGYVRKARRTSDIATAKEIYNNVNQIITENKKLPWKSSSRGGAIVYYDASKSFYTKGSSANQIKNGTMSNKAKLSHYYTTDENGEPYTFIPVVVWGEWYNKGKEWRPNEQEQQPFAQYLTEQMRNFTDEMLDISIKYQPPDQDPELNTWIVGYRSNDISQIEVWVGNHSTGEYGGSGTPIYRVYPDPTY